MTFSRYLNTVTSACLCLASRQAASQINSENQGGIIDQGLEIQHEVIAHWHAFLQALPLASVGLVIAVVLFYLARPMSKQLIRPISYMNSSILIQRVTRRVISLLIILFGVYVFLKFAGLGDFAVAVLSGTGLVGLVIGFAFKDIAENFISSLLLSIQKPFKIDDVIEVEGHLGVVKQVTARATTLVDFDGNHIQIPNATVYKNIIRNITANPKLRGEFIIGIGYDSSIVKSQDIAMGILANTEAVLTDPEPQVLVNKLDSSTINLKVYFWIDTHQHSLLKVSSLLMRNIMRGLEAAGISMPDDKRERIFPQGIQIEQAGASVDTKVAEAEQHDSTLPTEGSNIDQGSVHKEVDLSSDTQDIREQAKAARDPEQGDNIL